jgi:hypothetical protein
MILLLAIALAMTSVATAQAQGIVPYYGPDGQVYYRRAADPDYAPPNVPGDIIAPERPRGAPRQRRAAPPIAVAPLEPPAPEPTTTPAPAPRVPVESRPHPLAEFCAQATNAKAPLCRNVGSPRVQR